LAHSSHEFTDYHLNTSDQIYSGIADGNLRELGQIINCVPDSDQWYVRFAFFDKYGFGYEKKIHKMASGYEELKRHRLI
jgi:hypothetical protein